MRGCLCGAFTRTGDTRRTRRWRSTWRDVRALGRKNAGRYGEHGSRLGGVGIVSEKQWEGEGVSQGIPERTFWADGVSYETQTPPSRNVPGKQYEGDTPRVRGHPASERSVNGDYCCYSCGLRVDTTNHNHQDLFCPNVLRGKPWSQGPACHPPPLPTPS